MFQKNSNISNNATPTAAGSSKLSKSPVNTPRSTTNNNLNSLTAAKKATLNLNVSGNISKQNSSRSLTPVKKTTPTNQDSSINSRIVKEVNFLDLS